MERRNGLNLMHVEDFDSHVEFRYHSGTINGEKARHWLRFLLQMVRHATTRSCQIPKEQVPNSREGLENLLVCCGFKPNSGIYSKVSPELRETGKYLLRRWKQFQGNIPLKPRASGTKTKTEPEGGE
jgi:hypothetical protein